MTPNDKDIIVSIDGDDELYDKFVFSKLNKYYQENCLLEQAFIKDSDKNIHDLISEVIATLGENISVNRFTRFAIGENI